MDAPTAHEAGLAWQGLGIIGGLIFYSRFYVQWIASERAGRSVMPIVFWYMSSVGSVLLMAFAVATRSPIGALGQSFNLVVYGRNLAFIWREQGVLTPLRHRLIHVIVVGVALAAIALLIWVWWGEYEYAQSQPGHVSHRVWLWLAVGVVGQALFAARFVVQWAATEVKRRSVVPRAFWYLSLAAAFLMGLSFFQRQEWIFFAGMATTLPIYARNIWFVHRTRPQQEPAG